MTMRRALAGISTVALLGLGGCVGLTAEPAAEPVPPRARADCFQLGGVQEDEVETALAHWSTDPWNPL